MDLTRVSADTVSMAPHRKGLPTSVWWIVAFALCLSTGCGPFWSPGKYWPDAYWRHGRYYLIAIDTEAQMDLSFDSAESGLISLVGPTVYAVGANPRYVVVKQHPSSDGLSLDRATTNYFIVDRATEDGAGLRRKPTTIGPLTRTEFEQLGRKLQLPRFS